MSLEFTIVNGVQPTRGSSNSAGLDIHANEAGVVRTGGRKLISTGVFLQNCPENVYLRIAPRSKLANKHGIDVLAGVVDPDYTGEIMIILHNTGKSDFYFEAGDAIAQLIPEFFAKLLLDYYSSDVYRGERGINCDNR